MYLKIENVPVGAFVIWQGQRWQVGEGFELYGLDNICDFTLIKGDIVRLVSIS